MSLHEPSTTGPRVCVLVVPAVPLRRAVVLEADDRAAHVLGLARQDLLGRALADLWDVSPDDHDDQHDASHDHAAHDHAAVLPGWPTTITAGLPGAGRVVHRRGDGTRAWLEVTHTATDGPTGPVLTLDVVDVSAEVAATAELERREALFRRTVEALPVGLLRLDAGGRVVQVNARFGALLGTPAALAADTTAPLADRLGACAPSDASALLEAVETALTGGGEGRVGLVVDGGGWAGEQHCSVDVVALGTEDGRPGVLLAVQDVTESVRLQEQLARRATTDPLTRCLNRAAALTSLDAALAFAHESTAPAVVFLDLDGFKAVNDRLGHGVGDDLLVTVSDVLRRTTDGVAEVARLGGDEFLLVLPTSTDEAGVQALADAVCERLVTALTRAPQLAGHRLPVGASAGAARAVPGDTAASLVARADAAMYLAKRAGRTDTRQR